MIEPVQQTEASVRVHRGDCLEKLKELADNSVDSCVTDPPSGISFMGKSWDSDKGGRTQWVAWLSGVMAEVLRVVKPGGHALVWALPRTSHWTALALEDAGWEIRDRVTHHFGSGFPKSKNLGNGQGSALKPATEDWWLVRKPLSEKNLASNILKWGTCGLNIDASRVGLSDYDHEEYIPNRCGWKDGIDHKQTSGQVTQTSYAGRITPEGSDSAMFNKQGRFPANLLLSHSEGCQPDFICEESCPVRLLDEQSGVTLPSWRSDEPVQYSTKYEGWGNRGNQRNVGYKDQGGASRFFKTFPGFYYSPKASRAERNRGLEGMPEKAIDRYGECGQGSTPQQTPRKTRVETNSHPTVKPVKLLSYLCKLVTPPGGVVLDCFAGSGTTGVAALGEGFNAILIEQDEEYADIAEARCAHALSEVSGRLPL